MPTFVPFRVNVDWGDRLMSALKSAFETLANVVTNDHLVRVTIGTSDTKVFHGLGHKVKTWEVVDIDAHAMIAVSSTVNKSPETYLILFASTTANVLLRFA